MLEKIELTSVWNIFLGTPSGCLPVADDHCGSPWVHGPAALRPGGGVHRRVELDGDKQEGHSLVPT